jgi:acyl-CoA synthetase (NDP forming)
MTTIGELFATVRAGGRAQLTEPEAQQVLAAAGLAVPRGGLATSEDAAAALAARLGFPVVLKVVSPGVVHKSDAGGVHVGLGDAEAVRRAYRAIHASVGRAHPGATVHGVLVQEMVRGGIETIVGIANRPPFGPVVAFGLGGVFVEALGDVTFRLAPVDETAAAGMLDEIRGAAVLRGHRGQPPAGRAALARAITALSRLAVVHAADIQEMDVNPLSVTGDRVVALDARITLGPASGPTAPRPAFSHDIRAVLEPRSVAVVGASPNPGKTGHVLLENLVVNGFPGPIYPIHPTADAILGRRAYPSLLDVPGDVDLVFFLLPARFIPALYADCERKGVKAAVIIAAGFAEAGEEGAQAQRELEGLVRRTGVRCVGPNTVGLINMGARLSASFVLFERWQDGPIALGSQSGIFAGAAADEVMAREVQRIGIGVSLAFGNKIDLDETDFLEWAWTNDPTRVIGLHLEGLRDPRRFLALASRVKRDKPVVVLKPGRTPSGARASSSHTGSLAVDDAILDHALRQYGVVRAADLAEFLELLKAFAYQPPPRGRRVGVVTFSGANGVMAVDELTSHGFDLAVLGPATGERLRKFLPPWQPPANPLDLWASLGAGNRLVHEEGIHALLDDADVDAVLAILLGLANADFDGIRDVFAAARARHPDKPLYVVCIGGAVKRRWLAEIEGLNVPVFDTTGMAARALAAARAYAEARDRVPPDPALG